jgi:signal peptidase I
LRPLVETAVFVLVLAILGRTWLIEGLVAPFEVASGSMAETLLGPHRRIVCGDCGWEFACAADNPPIAASAVCPNCGYRENDLANRPVMAGDGLLIAKPAFVFRRPRRWEVIAFRLADGTNRMAVKRVVGLPGETVEIRDGDVYIDGQLARKTLPEQRAMAVLVHDANYWPRRGPAKDGPWRAEKRSQWTRSQGVFLHPGPFAGDSEHSFDWLLYYPHQDSGSLLGATPGTPGQVPEPTPSNPRHRICGELTDHLGYNQSLPQRGVVLHPVGDIRMTCRIRTSGSGRFEVRVCDGGKEFRFGWEAVSDRRRFAAYQGDTPLELVGPVEMPAASGETFIEVSTIDRQFQAALDGQLWVLQPFERNRVPGASVALAIGGRGLALEVRDLRVWRDVYYAHPMGSIARWGVGHPVVMGNEEFFVLGDNSLVSEDSRVWRTGPGVSASQIVGRPLVVHVPAASLQLNGVDFQVPAITRIRYIR